ncbi:TonB-dependent receptor [Alcaligenes pakistanensis]|uniref:TonB-dependent receptor n=1 Tax=Alcaligenes pakistanensis TaxID=1482717 RepID=A0A8H9M0V0_9BURK|nr:TonB-dependent receptor [Alcaligenes pakistanensis]GHC50341.1 TonB-dependent receptor [Alcaligenes pakistanensis]
MLFRSPGVPFTRLNRPLLSRLLLVSALSLATLPGLVSAATPTLQWQLPAQALDTSLIAVAQQASVQLLYAPDILAGRQAPSLHGSMTLDQALQQLLTGTGIRYTRHGMQVTLSKDADDITQLQAVQVHAAREQSTETSDSYHSDLPSSQATKMSLTLRETPQSVSVMTHQRIQDQSLTRITDVLQQAPGISVQNTGGSERFSVNSRGYSIGQYQLDGVPVVVDEGTQDVSPSLSDMVVYDRVELIRGATGLTTGSGDPSGTLNMIRKRPTQEAQIIANVGLGSWSRQRYELDLAGPINSSGTIRGRMIGAWQGSDSYIDYYGQKKQVLYGIMEADLGPNTLLTAGVDYQRTRSRGAMGGLGTPLFFSNGEQVDLDVSTNLASRNNWYNNDALNTFASVQHDFGQDWTVKAAVNRLDATRRFQNVMAGITSGFINQQTGDGLPLWVQGGDSRQTQTSADLHITGPYTLGGRRHEMVAGLSFMEADTRFDSLKDVSGITSRQRFNLYNWDHQAFHPVFEQNYDNDTYTREYAAYAATRLSLTDSLSVIGGLRMGNYRWQYQQLYADAPMQIWNQHVTASAKDMITPYLGVTYDLNDRHSLYASYTTIFAPQTTRDRNGGMLDPREGANYEVGVKSDWLDSKLSTSAALFLIQQDNLAVPDDGYLVPGTTDTAAYRGEKGARTRGLDLEINGELAPGWQLAASYAYSRTQDSKGERIRTTMPQHLLKVWTRYQLPGDWHRLTVGAGVNWQSAIENTVSPWQIGRPVTARQSAYAVTNAMAHYQFNKQLGVTFNVNNVFNRKYLSSIGTVFNTGYYGEPRNVRLNLRYAF